MTKYVLSALFIIGSFLLVFSGCSTSQKEQTVQIQEIADDKLPGEIIGKDGAPMALIPAGEFRMGSNHGYRDEKPVHTVYLDAFYMDKYEVTNAQYRRFVQETGHREPEGRRPVRINRYYLGDEKFKLWSDDDFNGDDHPVVGVKWEDAKAYAEWSGKRLPTEAEWEKAARGGPAGRKYPWGDWVTSNDGNFFTVPHPQGSDNRDKWKYTAPVGSFPPNGYGLYDMAGNVSEWCADWYDREYYAKSPRRNPTGPRRSRIRRIFEGGQHVFRGGSWRASIPSDKPFDMPYSDEFTTLRVAKRGYHSRDHATMCKGFRCVMPASAVAYSLMEDNTGKP